MKRNEEYLVGERIYCKLFFPGDDNATYELLGELSAFRPRPYFEYMGVCGTSVWRTLRSGTGKMENNQLFERSPFGERDFDETK